MPYTIEMLSLSKIGDMLREKLGDDVDQYKFPDDFEKAVVDIGFTALVVDGDTSPYDVTYIGNVLSKMSYKGTAIALKKAIFIGTTSIPNSAFNSVSSLTEVVLSESVTDIGYTAFGSTGITDFYGPSVDILVGASTVVGVFYNCRNLLNVYLPKCVTIPGTGGGTRGMFYGCVSLANVSFGSIGHEVTTISSDAFTECTSAFVLTIYTTGNKVDSLITASRNTATNATIIAKAAENTIYNGVSYSAGDTILTSQP